MQTDEQKEDFSHLPPSQQKKQLKLKIDELKSSYAKELAARLALICLLVKHILLHDALSRSYIRRSVPWRGSIKRQWVIEIVDFG